MIGLEAITANNGWAMAITGIIIVMLGLSVLAFIISQLHKIIGLFEDRGKATPKPVLPPEDIDILGDPEAAARLYKPLTEGLGESFHLIQLYRLFENENLPHPHLTIRVLREAKFLVPAGEEGLYSWNKI